MTEDDIKKAMATAESAFTELKAKADEIEDELKRLQGEYRGYENLLKQKVEAVAETVKDDVKKVKDAATTIEAKEATDGAK